MSFVIESPNIAIYSKMPLSALFEALASASVTPHCVTTHYYCIQCLALNGVDCDLGFHFIDDISAANEPVLENLEFFRADRYYKRLGLQHEQAVHESFKEFQQHLESIYGRATLRVKSAEFPIYRWLLRDAHILHQITERFMLEEYLNIWLLE
jgi:hypothetical protein